jgi:hypothetical protein
MMRIGEYCISSLFFHVIGVLLVTALFLHSPMGGSRAMTVSLLSLSPPGMAAATAPVKVQGTKENAVAASPTIAEENAVMTEEPPEARIAPAAQESPPSASEPEKEAEISRTAASGMAGTGPDLSGLAILHHIYAVHTRAFVENAALSLHQALHKEIESDLSGTLRDGTAEVTFFFNDAGGIAEVRGASGSDSLMSALGRLDWQSVPAPGAYRLKMKGLHVMIKIDKGEPSFFFTAL